MNFAIGFILEVPCAIEAYRVPTVILERVAASYFVRDYEKQQRIWLGAFLTGQLAIVGVAITCIYEAGERGRRDGCLRNSPHTSQHSHTPLLYIRRFYLGEE